MNEKRLIDKKWLSRVVPIIDCWKPDCSVVQVEMRQNGHIPDTCPIWASLEVDKFELRQDTIETVKAIQEAHEATKGSKLIFGSHDKPKCPTCGGTGQLIGSGYPCACDNNPKMMVCPNVKVCPSCNSGHNLPHKRNADCSTAIMCPKCVEVQSDS